MTRKKRSPSDTITLPSLLCLGGRVGGYRVYKSHTVTDVETLLLAGDVSDGIEERG